jgi:uncharacterized repeat protein (TIGR01451 family)
MRVALVGTALVSACSKGDDFEPIQSPPPPDGGGIAKPDNADLSVQLVSPASATAGSQLTYIVNVTNQGPSDAALVSVVDTLPDGATFVSASSTDDWTCTAVDQKVTCDRGSLGAQSSSSFKIVVTVPPTVGTLTSSAHVSAATLDPNAINNDSGTVSTPIAAAPPSDLSITAAAPATVRLGQTATYALTVSNNGSPDVTNITVLDTLPAGAALVSVTGDGWTCTNTATGLKCTLPKLAGSSSAAPISIVVTAPAAPTTITNTAQVSSIAADPVTGNNSVASAIQVDTCSDLKVAITADVPEVQGTGKQGCVNNDCVTYTITATNSGPDAAPDVVVKIPLPLQGSTFDIGGTGWVCPDPAGTATCTLVAPLAAGDTTPPIAFVWKAPTPGGFNIVVRPTVTSDSTDPNAADNTAFVSTKIDP